MKKITSISGGLLVAIILLAPNWAIAGDKKQVAGTVFRDCEQCPEMVVVPPGSFMMGSGENSSKVAKSLLERGWEAPVHKVTINYAFAVGRYPITFDEWDACVEDGGCNGYTPNHIGFRGPDEPGWSRGRHPVFRTSYFDAQNYLTWINAKTSGGYRLLSEAEWEYMARAGTKTVFNTGDTITQKQAKFLDKETRYPNKKGNWKVKTVPVGIFPPNAFGVYDVHGGVFERVQDCWHPSYTGAPSDGSAWTKDSECEERVIRGGGWNVKIGQLRIAGRNGYPSHLRTVSGGFRIAKSLNSANENE